MWGAHSGHCIMLKSIMLKNAFKKHPLQNGTNVQIKGGEVKGLLNNVQKNWTFLRGGHPLDDSIHRKIVRKPLILVESEKRSKRVPIEIFFSSKYNSFIHLTIKLNSKEYSISFFSHIQFKKYSITLFPGKFKHIHHSSLSFWTEMVTCRPPQHQYCPSDHHRRVFHWQKRFPREVLNLPPVLSSLEKSIFY